MWLQWKRYFYRVLEGTTKEKKYIYVCVIIFVKYSWPYLYKSPCKRKSVKTSLMKSENFSLGDNDDQNDRISDI